MLCSRSCPGIWYLSYLGCSVSTASSLFCVQPFICTTSPCIFHFILESISWRAISLFLMSAWYATVWVKSDLFDLFLMKTRALAGGSDGKESDDGAGDLVWSLVWEDPLRRKWLSTPGFLDGEFHGQRSLAGYSPWGRKESDMTERLKLWRWLSISDDI